MKHNGSQGFPEPTDVPEGIDWSWTAESQNEMADLANKDQHIKNMAESIDKSKEQHYNSKRSRGER